MIERVPPLDPDIAAVLAAEKTPLRVPSEEKARAFLRVAAACGQSVENGRAPSRRVFEGGSSWARAHPWIVAASAFTLGAGAGAALHAFLVGEHIVYVTHTISVPAHTSETPAAHSDSAPSSAPPAASAAPIPGVRSDEGKAASGSNASARRSGDTLAAERALIDVARRAVGAGDGAAAMAAVSRHERTFPWGLLREEREALAIRALVLLGRVGEARARVAEFRARYPGSLMAPAVDRAVASAPRNTASDDEGSP